MTNEPSGPIVPPAPATPGTPTNFQRKDHEGLAILVQGVLRQDPFSGHLFVFRGRTRANLITIVFWDGSGLCLFTKRLEHGVFLWPLLPI